MTDTLNPRPAPTRGPAPARALSPSRPPVRQIRQGPTSRQSGGPAAPGSRDGAPGRRRHARCPRSTAAAAPAGTGGPASGHRRTVPVEPRRLRLGERLLLRSSPGRLAGLDGLVLWLLRCRQRHHRGQAAGVAVGDGAVRAALRAELLEHPRAAGPHGGRHGLARLSGRPPGRGPRHGGSAPGPPCRAPRRCGHGADPGGRADVPVQQPRRPAGTPHDRGRLCRAALHPGRAPALAPVRRGAPGLRVPHQAAAGPAGCPRLRPGVPARGAGRGWASASSTCSPRARR